MRIFRKNKNKGFTLIELLVVVAIIGMLAAMIELSLGNARLKARDTRRLSDVSQIRTALELYLNQGGGYPDEAVWLVGGAISCGGLALFTVPTDPSPVNTYTYHNLGASNSSAACGSNVFSAYSLQFQTEGKTGIGPAGTYCLRPAEGITSGSCP